MRTCMYSYLNLRQHVYFKQHFKSSNNSNISNFNGIPDNFTYHDGLKSLSSTSGTFNLNDLNVNLPSTSTNTSFNNNWSNEFNQSSSWGIGNSWVNDFERFSALSSTSTASQSLSSPTINTNNNYRSLNNYDNLSYLQSSSLNHNLNHSLFPRNTHSVQQSS